MCESIQKLEEVDHTSTFADRIERLKQASSEDPVLDVLRLTVLKGWPETKSEVHTWTFVTNWQCKTPWRTTISDPSGVTQGDDGIGPHYSYWSGGMPQTGKRNDVLATNVDGAQRIHIYRNVMCVQATESCKAKNLSSSTDLDCSPTMVKSGSWFMWAKRTYVTCGEWLLIFSNYIEVENVNKPNTNGVTKPWRPCLQGGVCLKSWCQTTARATSSTEFARKWGFEHTTSSPQSNGKAENAVKTVKRLFTKGREAGQSKFQARRNTPTEGIGTSPAQRFL